jgi:hypothetical protein
VTVALAALWAGSGCATPAMTEMAGYLIVPHERVASSYNAGFSMYVAAWPLLRSYPGPEFQSGLFGTWMFPQFEGGAPKDHYTDVEGGLGWWRDTRFATETPKFIMGGVALNFSEWANGPGAGKGRDWDHPTGLYGVAQLSPWVLWPPDGLNLKQGTRGELFGYGYLPLPLTDPKARTAGKEVPTGGQCWTLFLDTENFKGPVAFFTPYFWSKASVEDPRRAGQFLDTMPSEPNKAVQMETQHIPAMVAKSDDGTTYARVAPTQFPASATGEAPLVHRITAYSKAALWDQVAAWFRGGAPASGAVRNAASSVHKFRAGGYSTWKIYLPGEDRDKAPEVDWASFAKPVPIDGHTFGIQWRRGLVSGPAPAGPLVALPEYYRLDKGADGRAKWAAVGAADVPAETGLAVAAFPLPKRPTEPYVTPDDRASAWKRPGPVAGPFQRALGDGSEVTYVWYRFADQPALQHADLSQAERERLQSRAVKLHRKWRMDGAYLPGIARGRLASIDPALLVKPPKGLEAGYVPIVTRQAWRTRPPGR